MIYWMIETNIISQREDLNKSLQKKIPEWAIYFEWIVSNWDLNRNWYIIDSNAWFFDKWKYVKNFLKSWSVLYWHNSDKPIWRPLSFELDWEDIKVSGYVFDDIYTNGAIWRGLVLWLSTGHITHERMWQDSKWKRKTDEEFWQMSYDEIFSWNWTMVVTKAEIVEFSFVTTPSNRASVVANEFSQKLNKDLNEVESLFLKYSSMNEKDKVVVATEENKAVENQELEVLKNEVETLKNDIASKVTEMETLKNDLVLKNTEINSLKETLSRKDNELELLKNEAKDKILAEVKIESNKNEVKSDVKTMEDFAKKYQK